MQRVFINSFKFYKTCFIPAFFLFLITSSLHAQTVSQVIIGNTSGISNWNFGPLYRNTTNAGTVNYSKYAYLYLASELGIPSGAKIIKLEWMKKDTGQVLGNNSFNVWISNTSNTAFTSPTQWSSLVAGTQLEFSSSTYSVTGVGGSYIQAPFIDSFVYGGGNLQILTDWVKLGYATGAVPFFCATATGKGIGLASSSPLSGVSNLTSSGYGNSRPTIRITYVTVPACTGTPNPGNTISSAIKACSGVSFNLSLQNTTLGGQVTYQWQSATNIGFTSGLTNLGTSSSLTTTQTTSKYYRCIVTCGVGPTSGTSTPVFMPMAATYECYCNSMALSTVDEDIFKFSFGTTKNCSDCSSLAPGQGSVPNIYSNYQNLTPQSVQKGATIPFSIEIGLCGPDNYPNRCAIFIDYNQNMSFADPGELVYSSPTSTTGSHIEIGNILIPANATTGLTGIRIINSEQTAAITDPCMLYSWGETEDYVINIQPSTNCSGAPSPGNTIVDVPKSCAIISGSYDVCSGGTINLTLSSSLIGVGYSYQWFDNNGLIAGATNPAYTSNPIVSPKSFYCNVTCTNSSLTTASTPISISLASFLNCYCGSSAGLSADAEIVSFSLNNATNISNCITPATGAGSVLNQYSNFTNLGNLTSVQVGTTVSFAASFDDCDVPPAPYYPDASSIWIDYNHNGSFSDPGEQVFVEPTATSGARTVSGTITIPCTALRGQTRLRITLAEGVAGSNLIPCLAYGFGETEDYLINIVSPITLSASSSFYCTPGGSPVTLTATGASSYTYNPTSFLSPTSGAVVTATPSVSTIYTVSATDANGCSATSTVSIVVAPCSSTLNLKLYIQGYYSYGGNMLPALLNQGIGSNPNLTDSITIEMHQTTAPYGIVATKNAALLKNGTASVAFPGLTSSYYIAVKHRNALETWSSSPFSMSGGVYDFTTGANKAYGNNQVQIGTGIWAFYSGDIVIDNNIDLIDLSQLELDIENFQSGYLSTDINGDGNVDLLDSPSVEENINSFIYSIHP